MTRTVEQGILTSALGLSASRVVVTVLSVVRGVVLARMLGPAGYGTLSAINLVASYAGVALLGLTNAVGLELPRATAQRDTSRVRAIEHTALMASATLSLTWAAVIWVIGDRWLGGDGVTAAVAAVIFALLGFTAMLEAVMYARGAFGVLTRTPIADAVVRTVVMTGAVLLGGLRAVLVALPLLQLAMILYYVRAGRLGIGAWGDTAELRKLLTSGFPLFVGGFFFWPSGRRTTGLRSGCCPGRSGAITAWRSSWVTSC